jgi:hypothetical protein
MSIWIILSWVLVAILTAINVFVFLKLKQATEQMLQMAFPGAKNMNEAMAKMQQMMGGMGGMGGMPGMARGPMPGGKGASDAQLKAAMNMLQQMQKGRKN